MYQTSKNTKRNKKERKEIESKVGERTSVELIGNI
jgi:hypothetical protein